MAIEIRFVQFWLRLMAESWDWIDWQVSRGSTRKKKVVEGVKEWKHATKQKKNGWNESIEEYKPKPWK